MPPNSHRKTLKKTGLSEELISFSSEESIEISGSFTSFIATEFSPKDTEKRGHSACQAEVERRLEDSSGFTSEESQGISGSLASFLANEIHRLKIGKKTPRNTEED